MANKTNTTKKSLSLMHRSVLFVAVVMCAVVSPLATAYADSYDDQIRALQGQMSAYQAQAAQFRAQADSLQNQVNALNAERAALQAQIDLNTAKLAQLNQQIIDTQKKIVQQQDVLSKNLLDIYLDSSVTPLEMVVSSDSIGDYIDKQEYRDTIRQQLQDSITTVKTLQAELNKQKADVENTLADQAEQKAVLIAKTQEQAELLAETQGQENNYRQLAAQQNARIQELRTAQVLANLKWGGNVKYEPRGGGYPSYWNDIPMDSTIDNWGMYNRECVSYAAFRVAASGRHMPYWGGHGNANLWPGNARAAGIPVDQNPKPGDIAAWPVGYYGHVMYVEAVDGSGNLVISEYNYDWTGRFSTRAVSHATWEAQDFQFIHFR